MKIAIPTAKGLLCPHFGHCEKFAMVEIDEKEKKIIGRNKLTPPPHEPGVLPRWLSEMGADMIIAGGMGHRAQTLFSQNGIKVLVGAPVAPPEKLALDYLEGNLKQSENLCDH